MWKHFKNKLKEKKGIGSIEIVIAAMITLTMIAGLIDMINIIQKFDTTSQATGYISRVVQKQGGVQSSRVDNFNGKYTPTAHLYNNVKEMMEANNIHEDNWRLTLRTNTGDYEVKSGTDVPVVNYGERIHISLEVDYQWKVLSTMFPNEFISSRQSNRQVLSGFQVRDGSGMDTDLNVE